jgi:hypothetical protein
MRSLGRGVTAVVAGAVAFGLLSGCPDMGESATGDAGAGGSPGGGGAGAGGSGGAAPFDAGRGPPVATIIAAETGRLVDVFVVPSGVILVTAGGARLVGRDGALIASYTSPREVRAAAFDGQFLAIADRAAVVALDFPSLQQHSSVFVAETCESGVLVSGHRFVCGPNVDWERVFTTYDLATGARIGSSAKYTYAGIPMRAVPGRDAFVTVTVAVSPTDFSMFRVGSDGLAVDHGDSPYHGDFAISQRFAYFGAPATHLITEEGIFLGFNPTCEGYGTNQCFQRTGDLGFPVSGQRFLAMQEEGDGTHLFAIQSPNQGYWGVCDDTVNCDVLRIDAASKTLVSHRPLPLVTERIDLIRYDGTAHRLIVGTETHCTLDSGCSGFQVASVEYE